MAKLPHRKSTTIAKPTKTRIKIQKSTDTLYVKIPRPSLKLLFPCHRFCIILLFSFYYWLFFIFNPLGELTFTTMTEESVLQLLILLLIIGILVIIVVGLCSEKHNLTLTRNKYLEIDKQFLGFKVIDEKCKLSNSTNVILNREKGSYNIRLYIDKAKYQLGVALREEEAIWLAQEIQDWLQQDFYS